MDHLVCVNKRGKPGQGIHRDKENEIRIRETKDSIRGMHCNLKVIFSSSYGNYLLLR
jgi:hypothetical protein